MQLVTSEWSERSSYYQSYIGCLDDIQTDLDRTLEKNRKKLKYSFIPILRLAESLIRISDPTVTVLTAYFSESIKDGREILTQPISN